MLPAVRGRLPAFAASVCAVALIPQRWWCGLHAFRTHAGAAGQAQSREQPRAFRRRPAFITCTAGSHRFRRVRLRDVVPDASPREAVRVAWHAQRRACQRACGHGGVCIARWSPGIRGCTPPVCEAVRVSHCRWHVVVRHDVSQRRGLAGGAPR